jgi:FkbM family methyltransferase
LDYFNTVVDIGANVGVFSMMMKMLHPKAKILAVEPSLNNLKELKDNIENMEIDLETRGLGDGSTMYHMFGRKRSPVGDWFTKDPEKGHFSIRTAPLWKIFKDNDLEKGNRLFIKIDCEGCEQYLIGDQRSENILKSADQVFLEIHFRAPKEEIFGKCVRSYSEYNKWVRGLFYKTHDIKYFKSDKNKGFGHYCIASKTRISKELSPGGMAGCSGG